MIVEHGYIDSRGRAWDLSRLLCYRFETWVASSLDESGDAVEADSRQALLREIERLSDEQDTLEQP